MSQLKVTQIKSVIGEQPAIRKTVRSLGLKHVGHTVVKDDVPSIRGMANSVRHLVSIEEEK